MPKKNWFKPLRAASTYIPIYVCTLSTYDCSTVYMSWSVLIENGLPIIHSTTQFHVGTQASLLSKPAPLLCVVLHSVTS